ncbi:hypothetical protein GF312_14900 [Candidatus Poribacteria bacterium]|nr:hypothetical protein [Candidatus Poribacteria bacterium]
MTKTKVSMDNCGIETIITGEMLDNGNIKINIESKCKSIEKMALELEEIDLSQAMQKLEDSNIFKLACKFLRHSACLVPAAVIRTLEVEAGISLPGKSCIKTERI